MKSAYELAMERMNAESGPSKTLTDEQKETIAAIDAKYDAQIAEAKLSYEGKIAAADYAEGAALKDEMSAELRRLADRRENEKEKVWSDS